MITSHRSTALLHRNEFGEIKLIPPPIKQEDVFERLDFAKKRLDELLLLNTGNLPSAEASLRQQLFQEFFFHVVGATEVLAQLINQQINLGYELEDVNIHSVVKRLPDNDPIKTQIYSLDVKTKKTQVPADPYSDEGYIYRLFNYRNQVTHRGRNPLFIGESYRRTFIIPGEMLAIDPRGPKIEPSNKPAREELPYMMELIRDKCQRTLSLIKPASASDAE